MIRPPKSLQAFKQALEKEKISLVIRQNDNGIVYGLTYIDHNTKCVFNGSDIGKDYSAKAILEKCGIRQTFSAPEKPADVKISKMASIEQSPDLNKQQGIGLSKMIEGIVAPNEELQYLPYELRKRRKKKGKHN